MRPVKILSFTLAMLLLQPLAVAASDPAFEAQGAVMDELAGLSGDAFEIAYVNSIIPHHASAIEMAEAVIDRAPHAAVRQAARGIIAEQRDEIALLTSFLQDTYGTDPQPDEHMMMPPSMMDALESASPARTEVMFLLMMREHHQSAVEMGTLVLDTATSDVLLEQASAMIASQQREQEQFGSWVERWYAVEAPAPTGHMAAAMELAEAADLPDTAIADPGSSPASPPIALLAIAALAAAAWWLRVVERRRLGAR